MYGFLAVVNGKACFYEEKKNVFKVCIYYQLIISVIRSKR